MSFEQRLRHSLEALPSGFKIHVHQLVCQPKKHQLYLQREPATHVQRLLLVRLENDTMDGFVCGLEVDEYTLEDKETMERVVYIAKVDTTGAFSDQRGNVTRRLLEAYLASVAPCSVYVFARSQPQYLFHESALHSDKRVLDDRGLIRWWRSVLTHCLKAAQSSSPDNKNGIAWWHVPGVDNVSMLERQVKCSPDPNWIYGFPFDPNARAVDVIPRFSDDVKARVLKDHDKNNEMTVSALSQLLEFTEECGSNHFAGLLGIHLPAFGDVNKDNGSESTSLSSDADTFTTFWNALMKSSFKDGGSISASTKNLCNKWKKYDLPEPITITTAGAAIEQQRQDTSSSASPSVNTLSSNMIKRSTSASVNTLTVKRKTTTTTTTTKDQPVNLLAVKRKDTNTTSTTTDQPVNILTVKRKTATASATTTTTDQPVNILTVKRKTPTTTTTSDQPTKRQREEDTNKDSTVQQLSIETSSPEPKRPRYESPTATSSSTSTSTTATQQEQVPETPRSFFGYLKSFFM